MRDSTCVSYPIYKKAKSKPKAEEICPSKKTHQIAVNHLPVRNTQFEQISIQELADATNIIKVPKYNPDVLSQEGDDGTPQSRKKGNAEPRYTQRPDTPDR